MLIPACLFNRRVPLGFWPTLFLLLLGCAPEHNPLLSEEQPDAHRYTDHRQALVAPAIALAQNLNLTVSLPLTSPWYEYHDLTKSDLDAAISKFQAAGYRPLQLSGYEVSGASRFAVVFWKLSGDWLATYNRTAAQIQSDYNVLVAAGYQPIRMQGWDLNGSARYAGVFLKSATPRVAYADQTWQQIVATTLTMHNAGYRLLDASLYAAGTSPLFATTWEKSSGLKRQLRLASGSAALETLIKDSAAEGLVPLQINHVRLGAVDQYAVLFDTNLFDPNSEGYGMSASSYSKFLEQRLYEGMIPLRTTGSSTNGASVRFHSVWTTSAFSQGDLNAIELPVAQAMKGNAVPGLSLAITKNERLVFAKGYGIADKATQSKVTTDSLFRVASLSKPITSMAVLKMFEEDASISISNRVFGKGELLGETFGLETSYVDGVTDITVRHLLNHTAANRGWNNAMTCDPRSLTGLAKTQCIQGLGGLDSWGDPTYESSFSSDRSQRITQVLAQRERDGRGPGLDPGDIYAYSNFGYLILGRVIEAQTSKSYETSVQEDVLTPAGVSRMRVIPSSGARVTDEVSYYEKGSTSDPYDVSHALGDAGGGWIGTPIDVLRVLTRFDGLPSKPDFINKTTRDAMVTPSTVMPATAAQAGYGLGWSVDINGNTFHSGSLPGVTSWLAQVRVGSDTYTFCAVANHRVQTDADGDGIFEDASINLEGMMWDILNGVSTWPAGDLF